MMDMHSKTHGQLFLEILNVAKGDKSKMFTLLKTTLEKVNPFPSEKVNFQNVIEQVTEMESIAAMKAARAGFNARCGAYMFAEDYIYLTAKSYKEQGMGDIGNFKNDFKDFILNNEKSAVGKETQKEDTAGVMKSLNLKYAR